MEKSDNKYAKKMLVAIGRLNAIVAGELFNHHGVKENYLEFYSKKDIHWIMTELNKVNKLISHVYRSNKTRLYASEQFGLYRTKRFPIGKIIPGNRIASYQRAEMLIANFLNHPRTNETIVLSEEEEKIFNKIRVMIKEVELLDIHPAIKCTDVYLTVYFQQKEVK